MALSFDAAYYLQTRPDVFQAYVATAGKTGLTWDQFALQHYNTYGRFEGANPNAIFNTNDYLLANPDVAKAGVNPFTHYLTYGATEDRSPDAAFISFASFSANYSAAYLAANPDLGKAGITTAAQAYTHFVLFGEFENRPASPPVTTGATGPTFTLTQGIDNLTGTAGNDTFIGDNSGTVATFTAGDQINGGAGTDTLKLFVATGTSDAALALPQLTSVESLQINGGLLTGSADFSTVAGLTNVGFVSPAVALANGSTFTVKTTAAESVSLTNVNVAAGGAATVALNGATALTLNGVGSTAGTTLTIDETSAAATSLSIASLTAKSAITLANNASTANLASVTVTGDAALSITDSLVGLKTVNASANSGGVTLDQSGLGTDNALAFTGGAGNDTIIFKAGYLTALDVLDGGAGVDVLRINDTTPGYAVINNEKNFETLSLGTTGATVDVSQLTSIKNLSVDNAGTTAFTNSSNTHTYTINDSVNVTAVNIANAVGQGTANVTLSNTDTTSNGGLGAQHTLGTLTLTGATTINLVSSNGGLVGDTHYITNNLVNSDNSSIIVTGNAGINFALAAGTSVGSSVDASALTGVLNVTGSNFNDIIKGGTAADTINGGAGADTLTGNGGNDIFNFASRAETHSTAFAGTDTTTANIDKITDFTGNGSAAGDSIHITPGAGLFGGAGLVFAAGTTATVTAVTVATAADFNALTAAVTSASAGGAASTSAAAQIYDVTVTSGNLAGHYAIINDDVAAVSSNDSIISITGAGALHASDFTFNV